MAIRHILRPEHEAQGLSFEDDEDFAYVRELEEAESEKIYNDKA